MAEVLIQRKGDGTEVDSADAIRIPVPSATDPVGLDANVEVEWGANEQGGVINATVDVAGIPTGDILAIADRGIVQVRAGYIDHDQSPVATIFYGEVERITFRDSGGQRRWQLHATTNGPLILQTRPRLSANGITIGQAVRRIYRALGIRGQISTLLDGDPTGLNLIARAFPSEATRRATLAPSTSDYTRAPAGPLLNAVTMSSWTTTRPAFEELNDLLERARIAIKQVYDADRPLMVQPDRGELFTYNIVDALLSGDIETLSLDLTHPSVLSAAPEQFSVPDTIDDDTGEVVAGGTIDQFSMVTVFDNRIGPGLVVTAKDPDLGDFPFRVTEGRHTLSANRSQWRTQFKGPSTRQEGVLV